MSDKQKNLLPRIVGERFRDAREKQGLSIEELANKAILSNSQIRQIEGKEQGAFYSPDIKYSSAKKVAKILGLPEEQAFDASETMLDGDIEVSREQKEFNEIYATGPKLVFKRIVFLLILLAVLGIGYWLLSPYIHIS